MATEEAKLHALSRVFNTIPRGKILLYLRKCNGHLDSAANELLAECGVMKAGHFEQTSATNFASSTLEQRSDVTAYVITLHKRNEYANECTHQCGQCIPGQFHEHVPDLLSEKVTYLELHLNEDEAKRATGRAFDWNQHANYFLGRITLREYLMRDLPLAVKAHLEMLKSNGRKISNVVDLRRANLSYRKVAIPNVELEGRYKEVDSSQFEEYLPELIVM